MTTNTRPEYDTHADRRPVVLVVEDEQVVARMYCRILEERYTVLVANDGPAALDLVDDRVDVVLLDRMMPGMSGDEVLEAIRERDVDCRVAMVTAVEPDLDIVAMGFDAYVSKPPTRVQLFETVESLLRRGQYSTDLRQYCSAVSKRAALRATDDAELTTHPEFASLEAEVEAMRARLTAAEGDLDDDMAFLSAIRRIDERAGVA